MIECRVLGTANDPILDKPGYIHNRGLKIIAPGIHGSHTISSIDRDNGYLHFIVTLLLG
jgi:hypothetical protein